MTWVRQLIGGKRNRKGVCGNIEKNISHDIVKA